jgi:hypothetical protein
MGFLFLVGDFCSLNALATLQLNVECADEVIE